MTDARSSLAVKIMNANPDAYRALVVEGSTPALAREQLEGVEAERLLAPPATKSLVAAYAMLAGLWLWHDGLSECHAIAQKSPENLLAAALNLHRKTSKTSPKVLSVQSVENDKSRDLQHLREMESTLAYWHAIMHRREGDFSNSQYWYARCQNHPALQTIAAQANDVINPFPADKQVLKLTVHGWNSDAFVDLVEDVYDKPEDPRHKLAVALQQLEWRTLFDHCMRAATAG